jgi:hypothetical protein
MNTPPDGDWTVEELKRVCDRQRWSLGVMAERLGALIGENVELMSIVQEMQDDLVKLRAGAEATPPVQEE